MFANRYTALVDACTLASVWRRNLLLSLAEAEFFRVRWSEEILSETERALASMFQARGRDDPKASASQSISAMRRAFPEANVEGYRELEIIALELPDAGDAHVLAAAIHTQAQTIVTENLKDFPSAVLAPRGIEAKNADAFIADTIALEEGRAIAALRRMRERLKRPEMTPGELIKALEANNLLETASVLAPHIESL